MRGAAEVAVPLRHLPDRLVEHKSPDGLDQARLLGDGDELQRRDEPSHRVVPAQQRLGAHRALAARLQDRLVIDLELPPSERVAELALHGKEVGGAPVQVVVKNLVSVPAGCLGLVHRRVSVAEHRRRRCARGGKDDADAARQGHILARAAHRRLEGVQ